MKFTRLIAVSALLCAFGSAQAAIVEGQDYTVLAKPIPQQQADKVEVLEFFGYFCPFCHKLDPILRAHEKTFAKDTYLRTEHVVWDDKMMNLARLNAAVNASGLRDVANPTIYNAMVEDAAHPVNYADEGTLKQWIGTQSFGAKLLAAYNDPAAKTAADNMKALTNTYQIGSTPTLIVGGKYQLVLKADFNTGMSQLDELIQKVRAERNMPTPAPKVRLKAKGAALAQAANR